jgi:hypothetical protein
MKFFMNMKGVINATIKFQVSSVRDLFAFILSESKTIMTLPAVKFTQRCSQF